MRHINRIRGLENASGVFMNEKDKMEKIAQEYFTNLFTTRGVSDMGHILLGVECCITDGMNQRIMQKYSDKEVFKALKGMG